MIIKFNGYDIIATVDEIRELLAGVQVEVIDIQEPPAKKSNKKIELDMGKVKALRAAGRTVEWIADDMKVSPATIYNRLKEEGGE